ncbi:MarR family winged helix-turn-helix transcriptional regulator [Amycolatopsis albispora]|uniref:MarR family transcriptional regulator n=1 Tax=Amycolatopsis albispora TaxID=1804986 RepID=A0A344L0F5_9PSEU|nr:MarR family transcriptional regulator [Amycolatopsis albispora]AXB41529.1 MarR family transcriptional regulator [Amycolatopsis albispora]
MSTRGEATELWLLWKRAYETTRAAVIADMTAASGLSEAELSVLVCLHEAGGVLRQSAIATTLGWDRTRLSHLLTRMEKRDYVARAKVANGVEITLRPTGRRTIDASVPALEASTQRHLLAHLTPADAAALKHIAEQLLPDESC